MSLTHPLYCTRMSLFDHCPHSPNHELHVPDERDYPTSADWATERALSKPSTRARTRWGALGTWARVNGPPRRNVRGARRGSGARNGSPDRRLSDPGDGAHDLQKERRACGQGAMASQLGWCEASERSSACYLRAAGWAVGFSLAGLPHERRAVSSGRADRPVLTS